MSETVPGDTAGAPDPGALNRGAPDPGGASSPDAPGALTLASRCCLSPSVALRDEEFGALAYHFGTRKLSFLKDRALVAVVRSLDRDTPLADVLCAAAVPPARWPAFLRALDTLRTSEMIDACPDS